MNKGKLDDWSNDSREKQFCSGIWRWNIDDWYESKRFTDNLNQGKKGIQMQEMESRFSYDKSFAPT